MNRRSLRQGCGLAIILLIFSSQTGSTDIALSLSIAWDRLELLATVRLNLASAGLRLPTGRSQAEELILSEFPRLILPRIFSLPLDSASTVGDAVSAGYLKLSDLQWFTATTVRSAAVLSEDLSTLNISHRLDLTKLAALSVQHQQPAEAQRPLERRATRDYSGIVIYADELLPVYGTKTSAMAAACLFPKIWDSDMNLIYERNMTEAEIARQQGIVRYVPADDVELWQTVIGNDPLRLLAVGVFGRRPTDLIIATDDALKIISSEANRRLLREGRVVVVLSADALASLN